MLTPAHVIAGTISLYPGASASAYLLAQEPAFIPMREVTVRWLADRRLKRRFDFALVSRRHVVGLGVDGGSRLDEALQERMARAELPAWR